MPEQNENIDGRATFTETNWTKDLNFPCFFTKITCRNSKHEKLILRYYLQVVYQMELHYLQTLMNTLKLYLLTNVLTLVLEKKFSLTKKDNKATGDFGENVKELSLGVQIFNKLSQ